MSRLLITDTKGFNDQVAAVAKAIPKRTPTTLYQAIQFYSDPASNRIRVVAGGHEGFVDRALFGCRSMDLGPVCLAVSADRFVASIRSIRGDDWTIEPHESGAGVILRAGKARFTLEGPEPGRHPLLPENRGRSTPARSFDARIPLASLLIEAGLRCSTATDPRAVRYALSGVLVALSRDGQAFDVVGTDGRRLIRETVPLSAALDGWPAEGTGIVVEPSLFRLASTVLAEGAEVTLTSDGSTFAELDADGDLVRAALVEGRFAPWETILKNAEGRQLLAITNDEDRQRLIETVKLASVTCDLKAQRDALLSAFTTTEHQHAITFRNRSETGSGVVDFAGTMAGGSFEDALLVVPADGLVWALEQVGGPFWWLTDGKVCRFATNDGGRDVLFGLYTDLNNTGIDGIPITSLGVQAAPEPEPAAMETP